MKEIKIDCLSENKPYSAAASRFVEVCSNKSNSLWHYSLRCLACYQIFHSSEKIMNSPEDPNGKFSELLEKWAEIILRIASLEDFSPTGEDEVFKNVLDETGSHYGNLFKEFNTEQYDEATKLLRVRLERNGFDFSFVDGKTALDSGCGGGRYTVALKRLGFAKVTGVDISEPGIEDAKKKLKNINEKNIEFVRSSVLELPFEDSSFDFVFSNGVLHHTEDLNRGIGELLRVLKSNGKGFLYLIESPGGIHWDRIEILRLLMKNVPYSLARQQFKMLGVPANRIFYILDHIMVPINIRLKPEEVKALLEKHGAIDVKRLNRGTDFDRSEKIYNEDPYSEDKYGVGENRYFFSK